MFIVFIFFFTVYHHPYPSPRELSYIKRGMLSDIVRYLTISESHLQEQFLILKKYMLNKLIFKAMTYYLNK